MRALPPQPSANCADIDRGVSRPGWGGSGRLNTKRLLDGIGEDDDDDLKKLLEDGPPHTRCGRLIMPCLWSNRTTRYHEVRKAVAARAGTCGCTLREENDPCHAWHVHCLCVPVRR